MASGFTPFSGFVDPSIPSGVEATPPPAAEAAAPAAPDAALAATTQALIEEAGGEHAEFAALVCRVVTEELSGVDVEDKPKIIGTLAGVMYMAKVYAAQQAGFDLGTVARALDRLTLGYGVEADEVEAALHSATDAEGSTASEASDDGR